jgi:hypothetical protein
VPKTIQFPEVVAVIRDAVEQEGRFKDLEKLKDGQYRVHCPLHHELAMSVYGPCVDVIEDYPDLNSALGDYVGPLPDYRYRNDLAGIKILGAPEARPPRTIRRSLLGVPPEGLLTESTLTTATPSDHKIIPGDRIGPLRLAGTIDEIEALVGQSPWKVPWHRPSSVLQMWEIMGLSVAYDTPTGNILDISIGNTRFGPWPDYWASYRTPEGVSLGTRKRELFALMGPPEKTESAWSAPQKLVQVL